SRGDCSARTGRTPACTESDRATYEECEWKPGGRVGWCRQPEAATLALTDDGLLMEALHAGVMRSAGSTNPHRMNERFAKQGWALTRARGRRRRRGDEPPGLSLLRRRSRRRTRSDERYFLGAWLLSRPGGVKWFPVAIRWVWGIAQPRRI